MTPFSIDHIQINDQLIDIKYWVGNEKQYQSVLFKIPEFERWLNQIRAVSWDNYWDNWQPQLPSAYNHRIVSGDIQRFFEYKMGITSRHDQPILGDLKRPMHKVRGARKSPSSKNSKTA